MTAAFVFGPNLPSARRPPERDAWRQTTCAPAEPTLKVLVIAQEGDVEACALTDVVFNPRVAKEMKDKIRTNESNIFFRIIFNYIFFT
jgi:hypothetical protein